jgi:hypothetical protein
VKPFPRRIDQRMHGGLGVCADIVAGTQPEPAPAKAVFEGGGFGDSLGTDAGVGSAGSMVNGTYRSAP